MSLSVGFSGTPPLWVAVGGSVQVQVTTTAPGNITASVPSGACAVPEVASIAGPSATFTFDGLVAGSTIVTFEDSLGETATLVIGVAGPLSLLNATPGSGPQPYAVLQATDPGFTGPITPVCVPASAGVIVGPGENLYGESGAGPSQNGPGPVSWIVTPLGGLTSVVVQVFDLAANNQTGVEITLPFSAASAIGAYAITFLDYLGLSGVAAGYRWTIRYPGLPPGSTVPDVDTGWTQPGGIVESAVLFANTYYTIEFEGNGAPPTQIEFLTGDVGDGSLSVVISDYAPPGRGISSAGYASEGTRKLPTGWFVESELVPGGEAYAVALAGSAGVSTFDAQAEGLKIAQRVQTAEDADLDSFLADFFGEACPFPRLPGGESDDSYRKMALVLLPAPSSTVPNLEIVAQAHLDRLGNGGVAKVVDWQTDPGTMQALGYPDQVAASGVFVLLAYWPATVGANQLVCDTTGVSNPGGSPAYYTFVGQVPQGGFWLDYSYLDYDYLLPPQDVVSTMPPWDAQLDALIKARKTAGRKVVYAMLYFAT